MLNNKLTIAGNLGRDFRLYGKDKNVGEIVIYDSNSKDTYVRATFFPKGKAFETIVPKLVKGAFVKLECHLATYSVKDETTGKYTNTLQVIVDEIHFFNNPLKGKDVKPVEMVIEEPIGEIVEGAELPEVELEEKPKRTRKSTKKAK